MGVFSYTATERKGRSSRRSLRGAITADSLWSARAALREQGFSVQHIEEVRPRRETGSFLNLRKCFRSRGGRQVANLCGELSALLGAGIPLLQALETMTRQYKGSQRDSLLLLRDGIAGGASLAEAMRLQQGLFDTLSVSMVDVGERTGRLEEVLEQLASFKERSNTLRNRVITALLYPAIVLMAGVGVMLFLMTFVVPKLLSVMTESGTPLPWPTRVVQAVSQTLMGYWYVLLAVIVLMVVGWIVVMRQKRLRFAWHAIKLRLPMIGPMLVKQAIVRIALTTSTLIRSGIGFVEAMDIVASAMTNEVFRKSLIQTRDAVRAGRDIGPALSKTGIFPPMVVQIVEVGQATGRLDEMLDRLASNYDRQVQTAVQRLIAVLEPVIILLLAVFVGFIVMAIIMPYMEAGNVL